MQRWFVRFVLPLACLSVSLTAGAQLTTADFDRALDLQKKYDSLVIDLPDAPVWQEHSDTLVYRKTVEGGHEFVLVDAAAQTKQPAFDHARLAAALSTASNADYKAATLPFQEFRFVGDRAAIEFRVENIRWRCDLHAWTCNRTPRTQRRRS